MPNKLDELGLGVEVVSAHRRGYYLNACAIKLVDGFVYVVVGQQHSATGGCLFSPSAGAIFEAKSLVSA